MLSPRTAIAAVYDKVSGKSPSYPRIILLNVTNSCNFACPMCSVSDARGQELAAGAADLHFELIRDVIQQSRRHGPIVHLFGGEPLLYKQIHDVIALVRRSHMISFLTTNGLLLQQHAAKLVTSGLAVLHVSLDGWDDDSQTKRGNVQGSFDRIIAGVKEVVRCRSGKLPILRMATVITENNYHSLDKIQKVVAELGVKEWTIENHFFAVRGVVKAHAEFRQRTGIGEALPLHVIDGGRYLSEEQVLELEASLARIRKNNERYGMRIDFNWSTDLHAYYSSAEVPTADSRCDAPYTRLEVYPSGQLSFCGGGHTIGNLHSSTIKGAWSGDKANHFRDMHRSHRIFPMCFRCWGIQGTISFDDRLIQDGQLEPQRAA